MDKKKLLEEYARLTEQINQNNDLESIQDIAARLNTLLEWDPTLAMQYYEISKKNDGEENSKQKLIDVEAMEKNLFHVGSHERWDLFMEICHHNKITDEAYNIGLDIAYTTGKPNSIEEAEEFFEHSDINLLLDGEGKKYYDSLPVNILIYRGCNLDEMADGKVRALSWSLKQGVAEFFAFRNGRSNSGVYRMMVDKSDVYALFLDREEYEVIVLPSHVKPISSPELIITEPTELYMEYIKEKDDYYNNLM